MRKLALTLLVLTLTACGASTTGAGNDSTGAAPSVGASAPAASPAADPSTPASDASPDASTGGELSTDPAGGSAALETRAATALATQLNKPAESLKLVSKEQQEWSDGSLGCPQPGMMYTQAIVPGYKLTYDDGSRTYDVHTDESGATAVWCDNGQAKEIPQS